MQEARAFDIGNLSKIEQEQWARKEGYKNWAIAADSFKFKERLLYRLRTRPEMEKFWLTLHKCADQDKSFPIENEAEAMGGYLATRACLTIEEWFMTPRITERHRQELIEEISRLASALSEKIQALHGDKHFSVDWHLLLAPESVAIEGILHPKIVEKIKAHHMNGAWAIRHTLPLPSELMRRISIIAMRQAKVPTKRPRKINAAGALRTFFLGRILFSFGLYGIFSPTLAATFVSCALDDPEVDADTVRKHPVYIETNDAFNSEEDSAP